MVNEYQHRHQAKRYQDKRKFYIATSNLLNFANQGKTFYDNAEPYDDKSYQRKLAGLTALLAQTKADIIAVQEIWDENALIDLANNLGFDADEIYAPLISNEEDNPTTKGKGAVGTPSLGIISRFPRINAQYLTDIEPQAVIEIPDIGAYTNYDRPPLMVTLDVFDQPMMVVTAHLKSKRPHYLRDEHGKPLEDIDDPNIRVRAKLRSLCIRAAQASSLRMTIMKQLESNNMPMIVLGDMNDVTMSVTTQLLSEAGEVNYDKQMRDVALFDAAQIQTKYGWMQDMAYSHIHQGMPEVIDQLLVSEEFLVDSKYALGYVERVDYFNDHLKWDYHDRASDHGVVRAKLVLNR